VTSLSDGMATVASLSLSLDIRGHSRAKAAPESVNEDAYLIDAEHRLFGVFDGLGATTQAAQAADLAVQAVRAAYAERGPEGSIDENEFLSVAVEAAGTLISTSLEDGLTTASVVKVHESDGRTTAAICNVGDSRVYRYTAGGELEQCTLDDSIFGSDWDLQLRLSEIVVPTGLLDVLYLAQRHVLDRCLGEPGAVPHRWETGVDAGDVLLAVTDGVTDNLTFSEVREVLRANRDRPDRTARALVDAAYARSRQADHPRAKTDDITAVTAHLAPS
jgi:PPM family protein phosphatase